MHMISKKDLNDAEMDTLTKSRSPTTVILDSRRRISTELRNASVYGVSRGDENLRELLKKFVLEYPCW